MELFNFSLNSCNHEGLIHLVFGRLGDIYLLYEKKSATDEGEFSDIGSFVCDAVRCLLFCF